MADATTTPDAVTATTVLPSPDVVASYNAVNLMAGSGIFDYSLPGVVVLEVNLATTFSAGYIHYFPIRVAEPINVTKLGIYISAAGAAGEEAVFGIYNADIDLAPDGASLVTVTLAIDATGAVDSGAIDIDLAVGTYLVAMQAEGDVDLQYLVGRCPDTVGFDAGFVNHVGKIVRARTYDGTNPSPGPSFNAYSNSSEGFLYPFGLEYSIL